LDKAYHLKILKKMIVKALVRARPSERDLVPAREARGDAVGVWLALACSGRARHAPVLKTKGFAVETTHLTAPTISALWLALLAFVVALTVKTDVATVRLNAIPVKKNRAAAHARCWLSACLHAAKSSSPQIPFK
jgi:hypothetical protein